MQTFTLPGYEIIEQIGINSQGGRVTHLCLDSSQEKVVVKQFVFNRLGDWSDFKLVQREAEVLQFLDCHNIPQYLDLIQTDDGFCLVYQYIEGKPLSEVELSLEQIHEMAIAILKILVLLQSQPSPIVHRDIKPENIILGDDGQYYLIDFGFASLNMSQKNASSVIAGTNGFMPLEQLLKGEISKSTDLYGLGVTLFCLLSETKTHEVAKLIDSRYQIPTGQLDGLVDEGWLDWLQTLLESNPAARSKCAAIALSGLRQLDIYPRASVKTVSKTTSESSVFSENLILPKILWSFFLMSAPLLYLVFSSATGYQLFGEMERKLISNPQVVEQIDPMIVSGFLSFVRVTALIGWIGQGMQCLVVTRRGGYEVGCYFSSFVFVVASLFIELNSVFLSFLL